MEFHSEKEKKKYLVGGRYATLENIALLLRSFELSLSRYLAREIVGHVGTEIQAARFVFWQRKILSLSHVKTPLNADSAAKVHRAAIRTSFFFFSSY